MTWGDDAKAWTGDRQIAVFWRDDSGPWYLLRLDVRGSGPGATFRRVDNGEPVTAAQIRGMAESKRRQEKASVCAYHARKGGGR